MKVDIYQNKKKNYCEKSKELINLKRFKREKKISTVVITVLIILFIILLAFEMKLF